MASASTMRVFAVADQKGGVGKTTTTTSLGAALAEKGNRVSHSGSRSAGKRRQLDWAFDGRQFEKSVYDVLLNDTPMVEHCGADRVQ